MNSDSDIDATSIDELVFHALRRWRWLLVAGFVGGFAGGMASTAVPKSYRASTLVTMAEGDSVQVPSALSLSALGGLAALAGLPSPPGENRSQALAVLQSASFAMAFIRTNNLASEMFAEDSTWFGQWFSRKERSDKDAVRQFQRDVLEIVENQRTGLVTISLVWPNRDRVHEITNTLISQLNDLLRTRRVQKSEVRIAALQTQLDRTHAVAVRAALLSLLEQELKVGTVASTQQDFALVVLDPAQPADEEDRAGPQRLLWALSGSIVASALLLCLLYVQILRRRMGVA
jgi:hypothetical protein